jgi:hypothetical protein
VGYVPNFTKAMSLRSEVIEAWQKLISTPSTPGRWSQCRQPGRGWRSQPNGV